jgi:hypothetical protein
LKGSHDQAVWSNLVIRLMMQQLRQAGARSVHSAFHCSDRHTRDLGSLLIGQPLCCDEEQGFALINIKAVQGCLKVLEVQMRLLVGMGLQVQRI